MATQQVTIKNYDFHIKALFKEAWQNIKGTKRTILGALLLAFLIILPIQLILTVLNKYLLTLYLPGLAFISISIVARLISIAITAPIMVGLSMLGLMRARQQTLSIKSIFSYYPYVIGLVLFNLIFYLVGILIGLFSSLTGYIGIAIGLVLYVFCVVVLCMVPLLIVDKQCNIIGAVTTSFNAVMKRFSKVTLFMLINFVLQFLGVISLIGWIWLLPLGLIAQGILYREMFE